MRNWISATKVNKNCCHQSCTLWLQYAPNRLSAGASPQTALGSLQRSSRPLRPQLGLRGHTSKGAGRERGRTEREGEERSPSFALGRKKETSARMLSS